MKKSYEKESARLFKYVQLPNHEISQLQYTRFGWFSSNDSNCFFFYCLLISYISSVNVLSVVIEILILNEINLPIKSGEGE